MNQFYRIISIGIALTMCFSIVVAMHASESDTDRPSKNNSFRNAQINAQKWPNGVIPYEIEETSEKVRDKFLQHMVDLAEQTDDCISFVPRTNEESYLIIKHKSTDGCYSSVGMQPKPQTLSLSDGCTDRGALFHETLHAAGFQHEQCRPDRDDYLEILVENVEAKKLFNFDKYSDTEVTTLDLPYDYYSIMHYDVTSFTKDPNRKLITMRVKDPNVESDLVGESQVLTLLDILKVKKFYGCIPDSTNTLTIAINEKDSGTFISASAEGLIADSADSTTSSQQFEISFNYDSTVCLKSLENEKYISVDGNCIVTDISDDCEGDDCGSDDANQKDVSVDGNCVLMANSDDCESDAARFYLARLRDGDYVLKSKNNLKYINKNENLALLANVDLRSDAAIFIVTRL